MLDVLGITKEMMSSWTTGLCRYSCNTTPEFVQRRVVHHFGSDPPLTSQYPRERVVQRHQQWHHVLVGPHGTAAQHYLHLSLTGQGIHTLWTSHWHRTVSNCTNLPWSKGFPGCFIVVVLIQNTAGKQKDTWSRCRLCTAFFLLPFLVWITLLCNQTDWLTQNLSL